MLCHIMSRDDLSDSDLSLTSGFTASDGKLLESLAEASLTPPLRVERRDATCYAMLPSVKKTLLRRRAPWDN